MEIALACDLIVAARGAKLGIPEVKRALVAASGGLLRLRQRLPYHVAMEMALTGDSLPAEPLHELRLVNRLCDAGTALETALELAQTIIANGPLAVTISKQIIKDSGDWDEDESWERQRELATEVFDSEDAREGAAAFREKRDPIWRGR